MKYLGKAIATCAVWLGIIVLARMFHDFGLLGSNGAGGLVFAGCVLTIGIWKIEV